MLRWDKIHEYFQLLGDLSERIEIHELGKTTLGNPFILAVISSPENLARLDDIRETARTLALETEGAQRHIAGKQVAKAIVVPGRLVNIVVK